jgi:excisionase family DNA binding protein
MDDTFEALLKVARGDAYGSLGLDPDPEMGFAGVHALRNLADFCEAYQVRQARQAGHSWAKIASWAGVSAQALHKKYAQGVTVAFPDPVEELTPAQAAAELGVSRPLLLKLLDDGTIASRQLPGGRHRKIARADVDAYQAKKVTRRRLIAEAMNEVVTAGEYLPE